MEKELYEKLMQKKKKGEKLDWNSITIDELEELFEENISDSTIADLYEITKSKVIYKRKKWDINMKNSIFKKMCNTDIYKNINLESKKRLLDRNNIPIISKALTHYLFRRGPVEDMHSDGKLSQEDMKILNKFMVDRLAGLLEFINEEEWLKLELLLNVYSIYGTDWDEPNPERDIINNIYNNELEDWKNKMDNYYKEN